MSTSKSEELILMSDGGGGSRTQDLIASVMINHLENPVLDQMDDAAQLHINGVDLAFTTDSFVVRPMFFPGGDIGRLAACGTINDLAMQGARPLYLSFGIIIDEGLPVDELDRIVASFASTVAESRAIVATGDTKVVERGSSTSGVIINTSGIGVIEHDHHSCHVAHARPGDVVIVSGTLGDHGMAIMSQREGLRFESDIESDARPLWDMTHALLRAAPDVHCLRDPTRGGLAAALCDIAIRSNVCIRIAEEELPVHRNVLGACRMLGLDPLNVANEGKAVIVVPQRDAGAALSTLHSHPDGKDACVIGRVDESPEGMVLMRTTGGGERIVQVPSGENMPRIC